MALKNIPYLFLPVRLVSGVKFQRLCSSFLTPNLKIKSIFQALLSGVLNRKTAVGMASIVCPAISVLNHITLFKRIAFGGVYLERNERYPRLIVIRFRFPDFTSML